MSDTGCHFVPHDSRRCYSSILTLRVSALLTLVDISSGKFDRKSEWELWSHKMVSSTRGLATGMKVAGLQAKESNLKDSILLSLSEVGLFFGVSQ